MIIWVVHSILEKLIIPKMSRHMRKKESHKVRIWALFIVC